MAQQLTGDPRRAQTLAVQALAQLPRRTRGGEPALDRDAAAHLVRRAEVPRRRAAVVLAFGLGWDAGTIAEVTHRTARGVRRDIRAALADRGEDEWRARLDAVGRTVAVPADLERLVRVERAAQRRRRRTLLLGAAGVGIAALGTAVVTDRVVTAPAPLPPVAHAAELLTWPPRGALVRDAALRSAAVAAWRSADAAPHGHVYVLYAGGIDGRPVVVLQGRLATGAAIAVLTRVRPDGPAAVSSVSLLTDPSAVSIAITTEGDTGVPVTRLLVAPGVVRVAERTVHGEVPQERPAYMTRDLHDGLSEPWVSAEAGGPLTAVRLRTADGASYVGLLDVSALQPRPARALITPPPGRWGGLPARLAPAALNDDAVWFAQLCRDASPLVQLTWVGRAPGFPAPLRVERVGCDGQITARFVTGVGAHAITLAGNRDGPRPRVAYAAVVTPPTMGHPYVVVVGSRRVADITISGERRFDRVAVVPFERAGDLRLHAVDGTLIPLR